MNTLFQKHFISGLGVYAVCIALATAPLFEQEFGLAAAEYLAAAAVLASLLVMLFRVVDLGEKLGDPRGIFLQALFGIAVCAGLYTLFSPLDRPQVIIMSLLWVAVGLTHLTPRQVLLLTGCYLGFYAYAELPYLMDPGNPSHYDALFMLCVSLVVCAFMYSRAHEYDVTRRQARAQASALREAEEHIHAITVQDSETTALKFAYFRNELVKQKARVDSEGGMFSVGLIEIDRYAELAHTMGEAVTGQLLREFTERAAKIIHETDIHGTWDKDYKPLGRISGGRFGLVLPNIDFEGAIKCAERLNGALEFQSIRTHIGVVSLSLSIGITEYALSEDLDEVMELAARALVLAQAHNGNDFKGLKRPSGGSSAPARQKTWTGAKASPEAALKKAF